MRVSQREDALVEFLGTLIAPQDGRDQIINVNRLDEGVSSSEQRNHRQRANRTHESLEQSTAARSSHETRPQDDRPKVALLQQQALGGVLCPPISRDGIGACRLRRQEDERLGPAAPRQLRQISRAVDIDGLDLAWTSGGLRGAMDDDIDASEGGRRHAAGQHTEISLIDGNAGSSHPVRPRERSDAVTTCLSLRGQPRADEAGCAGNQHCPARAARCARAHRGDSWISIEIAWRIS